MPRHPETPTRDHPVYCFIADFQRRMGYSPSYIDIGEHLYMSKSLVHYHINRLKQAGLIEHAPGMKRALVLK